MGVEVGGLFGLLVLIADVWAIVNVVASRASTGAKLVWVVAILLLPVLGLLLWLVAGPRSSQSVPVGRSPEAPLRTCVRQDVTRWARSSRGPMGTR